MPSHPPIAQPAPAPGRERWLLAAALAAMAARLFFLWRTRITFEDALISLRYAENLAAGAGLVYNPGERVFGASTPLYVLFLALLSWLHLPALLVARVAALVADGVTLLLWSRWLLRSTGSLLPPLGFALLLGLSPIMVEVGVSGMETSFALLLLTLAFLADLEERPRLCGAALGLLILVRPDGVLAAAVLLGARWLRTRKPPWTIGLIALAVTLPWALFTTLYYGSPIPHSIPAKIAAYNIHRHNPWVNPGVMLRDLSTAEGPPVWPLSALTFLACVAPGVAAAWRTERLRPVAALFGLWLLYLAVPRTVLFTWYYPLLLLPAFVLAALGLNEWRRRLPERRMWIGAALAGVGIVLAAQVGFVMERRALLQRQELAVRRSAGLWLRDHTAPDARIALEPLGYMGYYSRRRILDEVGLVSPEMVPLNRKGDGWFAEMLRRFRPEYVVERPVYLLRNRTLLSGVRMFNTPGERDAFAAEYEPIATFRNDAPLPRSFQDDYWFVVFRRRTDPERARWNAGLSGLSAAQREERVTYALSGGRL